MTVLVTGASGFLGEAVVAELRQRGRAVVAYDIAPDASLETRAADDDDLSLVRGDMANFPELSNAVTEYGVTAAVPLAYFDAPSVNLVDAAKQYPYKASNTNNAGFNNVLEVARQFDFDTVVWPSSGVVYGSPSYYADLGLDSIDEDAPTDPGSLYGACKVKNEFMAGVYREQYGLDIAGLRLPLVYGPGRPEGGFPFITDLFEEAATGGEITISDGDTTWDLMYKKDIGRVFLDVLEAGSYIHDVYNVIGHTLTVRELVDHVRERAHPDASIQIVDGDAGFLPAPLNDSRLRSEFVFEPGYSPERAVEDFIGELRS